MMAVTTTIFLLVVFALRCAASTPLSQRDEPQKETVSASGRSLMKACSEQNCESQDFFEETGIPDSQPSFAEDSDSETAACPSATLLESAESRQSTMGLDDSLDPCDALPTIKSAAEYRGASMDREKKRDEEMSSAVAVEDIYDRLNNAERKQIVDSGSSVAEMVVGSVSAADVADIEAVILYDVMDLEEVMGVPSDQAPQSLPILESFAVSIIPSIEEVYYDYAPELALFAASIPQPDRVTQNTVMAKTPHKFIEGTPPSATKDDGIVRVGQPVLLLTDTRPDPRAFIAVVEQYSN